MRRLATAIGSRWFLWPNLAMLGATGWLYAFSDEWWTRGDRYVTFGGWFMMIIFQASQNIDTKAVEKKLDELIRALPQADNSYIHLEDKKQE